MTAKSAPELKSILKFNIKKGSHCFLYLHPTKEQLKANPNKKKVYTEVTEDAEVDVSRIISPDPGFFIKAGVAELVSPASPDKK